MLKRILWLLLLAAPFAAHAQTAALPVYDCIQHATQATVSGLKSTNWQQGIIKSCTVTIYLTGTTNIATSSPQSPYTANTDGSLPPTYVATGQGYDVVFSGGIPPNTYPAPVTLTDVQVGGGGGGTGCQTGDVAGWAQFSDGNGGCLSEFIDSEITNSGTLTMQPASGDRIVIDASIGLTQSFGVVLQGKNEDDAVDINADGGQNIDADVIGFCGYNGATSGVGDGHCPNGQTTTHTVYGEFNVTDGEIFTDGGLEIQGGFGGGFFQLYPDELTFAGSPYTLDYGPVFEPVDATNGNVVINLDEICPSETYYCNNGLEYIFTREDTTGNTVTINAFSGQTINGSPSVTLTTQYQAIDLLADYTGNIGGTPAWVIRNASGSGGDAITSPNSTLAVGGTSANTTLDLNLSHVNLWLADQNHLNTTDLWSVSSPSNPSVSISNASVVVASGVGPSSTLTSAHLTTPSILDTGAAAPTSDVYCVQIDDTGLLSNTGATCGSGGSGAVNSVTAGDSTLTISPTLGAVVAALNLANANTWTALQTFGTDISIGGVTPSGATGTGNIVFATSPTFVTPALGTPASGVITNLTGTCSGCTANAVTSITGTQVGTAANLAQYDFYLSGGTSAAPTGLACGADTVLEGSATTPTCTATAQLGASGTLGSVKMGNATSGTVTLEPITGALGTVTASLPANSGTIGELNLAQTWSALQTYSAGINLSSTGAPLELAGSAGTSGQCVISGGASTTPSWGSCGSAMGSVTSVALALPASVFSISGSPVSTAGTLTGAFISQTANMVFAAPCGSSGTPTFRVLCSSDIPPNAAPTTGQAGSVAQALTMNNSGSGAASGTTYNGSAGQTISYNTIGAAPAIGCTTVSSLSPANNGCYQLSTSSSVAMPSASAFTIFTVQTESGATATFTSTTLSSDAGCSGFISGGTLALTGNHSISVKSDGTNVWASCI